MKISDEFLEELQEAEQEWEAKGGLSLEEMKAKYAL